MRNDFLSREKRQELNSAKRFIRRESISWIAWVAIITIALTFVGGEINLAYKASIERQEINIARENFEQSKSRLHGLADDLAKYKFELATEDDPIARKAMVELIIDRTSSLNVYDLEDPELRQFVKDVKNGYYND